MPESKAVFLSYASQDAATARRIGEALRAAGAEVWLDTSELRGGDIWDQTIRRQIKDCALFIPIISAHTQARTEGYFRLEWRLAEQRTHLMGRSRAFLVPVCIDETRDADADVPESFAAAQWTRLPGGEVTTAFVERVAYLLSAGAAAAPALKSESRPLSAAVNRPRSQSRQSKASIGLMLLAIVVVVGGYWASHRQTPPTQSQTLQVQPSGAALPAPSAIPEMSVAVLAFADMSEKKDQEYFSDGLAEEMIDLLSRLSVLRVPARTSSFYFKGKNEPIASIAQQLKVANVLEGSVRKAGKRLRITVQLIRADNGYHLWSQTYDRQDSDIFAIQDDIAKAVVVALRGTLEGGASAADAMRGTTNVQAYNEYLRGRELRRRGDALEDDRHAVAAFERAIILDPTFSLAFAELSLAEENVAELTHKAAGIDQALRHAERAITLAPDEARGYTARGRIRHIWLWDWPGAQADFEKTLSLNPHDSHGQNAYACLLVTLGRLPDSIEVFRRVTELDPLWHAGWQNLMLAYEAKGDYAAAEAVMTRAQELEKVSARSYDLATLRLLQGRNKEALENYEKLGVDEDDRLSGVAMAEHSLGHAMRSQQMLDDLIEKYGQTQPYDIAEVFAWRGEADKAFEWLERAYRQRDIELTSINLDSFIQSLRADPRYEALLTKMKQPERRT